MNMEIKHRRLYAFHNSKVLNALEIVLCLSVLMMDYTGFSLLSVVAGALVMALFVGYSLWLWLKKPQRVVIDRWLSNMGSLSVLYFLIVVAIRDASEWWYVAAVVFSILTLFVGMVRSRDELFEI